MSSSHRPPNSKTQAERLNNQRTLLRSALETGASFEDAAELMGDIYWTLHPLPQGSSRPIKAHHKC
jgi:hypothetical protein